MTAALQVLPNVAQQELRRLSRAIWAEAFAPPVELSLPQIADNEFRLSAEYSAQVGQWVTDRVPYLRGILNALWDEDVPEVTFKKPAQVGGSVMGQIWLYAIMRYRPAPTLMMWQGEKAMKAFGLKRLDPMIRDCPRLAEMFQRTARRESDDAITTKGFPGGYLQLLTAKSTADLRSLAAPNLLAEEIDEWEGDIKGQGDPLSLFRNRARAFEGRSKLYKNSTPALAATSRISQEYENSSMGEFYVPCPHCQGWQVLRWRDPDGRYRLICDRDAANQIVPASAQYLCEHCGILIDERHKEEMLLQGSRRTDAQYQDGWKHLYPERPHKGFHIETIASPLVTWAAVVQEHQNCRADPSKLKVFENTWRGLAWKDQADEIDGIALSHRQEAYAAEVPRGVGLITAFVDVQGDRLELFAWGWGVGEEEWFLRWEQLEGNPSEEGASSVWNQLDYWLFEHPWAHETGHQLRPISTAIDANYLSAPVHRYCARRKAQGVFPTIGRDGRGRKLIEAPGPEKYRRGRPAGGRSHIIGVDSAKDLLAQRLKIRTPGPGYIHFPELVDGAPLDQIFFDQLSAERRQLVYVHGHPHHRWVKDDNRRNEALDGAVGALAALYKLGPAVINHLGDYVAQLGAQTPQASSSRPVQRGRRTLSDGLG